MKIDTNKIMLERANQGLTIGELAERSGLDRRTVSRIEKNGNDGIKLATVGKVANALGKRIEDFAVNEKR